MTAAVLQTSCNYLLHKSIWLQLHFSFLLVFERGSSLNLPYSPGCPRTHSVAQAWTLSNPSSASLVLGLLGYTCINHFPVGFGQGMSLQLLYPRVELPLCELFIKVFVAVSSSSPPYQILWLERDTSHMGSCIWIFGPQLVVLFEKFMEPLECRVLLKEICPWEQSLRVFSLAPFPVWSLCSLCINEMWLASFRLWAPCFPQLLPSLLCWTLSPWNSKPK